MSGYLGENLTRKSDQMPWYKGFKVKSKKKKLKDTPYLMLLIMLLNNQNDTQINHFAYQYLVY